MIKRFSRSMKYRLLITSLSASVCLMLLGCSQNAAIPPNLSPTPTVISIPIPSITAIPPSISTVTVSPQQTVTPPDYGGNGFSPEALANPTIAAIATQLGQRHEIFLTAMALTPTVADVTWTPEPTPTFAVGMVTDLNCKTGMPKTWPVFHSCWRTIANGAWYFVGAGYAGYTSTDVLHGLADQVDAHGLLWICPEPCSAPVPELLVPAPRPDLRIIGVQGSRITLRSRDSQILDTFIFDILTHQWVAPVPLPTSVIADPFPPAVSTPTPRP